MVHERHPDLERRRHRHLVEVQEHVVDQRQARVEVQRLAQRRCASRRRGWAHDAGDLGLGPGLQEVRVEQLGALVRLHDAAHRQQPRDRVVGGRGGGDAAGEARARARRARGEPPRGRGRRVSARDRGDLVLAVAAEQLVGALAGERDGHVLARQPAEQQEAEAGDVGDRLLEVPERLVEQAGMVGGGGRRARGGRCRAGRRRAGRRASSFEPPSSAKPIENVCTGPVGDCSAISAVIRLESRPPQSITPSGTSEIMRSRTAVAQEVEQLLLVLLPGRCLARLRRPSHGVQ